MTQTLKTIFTSDAFGGSGKIGKFDAFRDGDKVTLKIGGWTGNKFGTLYPATGDSWNISSAKKVGTWAAGVRVFADLASAIAWLETL